MADLTQANHKVVVITGASAGVGRAAAREFAREKARVALLARNEQRLEQARREVEELGGKAVAIAVDVADPQQVEAAADRVEQELGPIDIWVNNAMTTVFAPLTEITAHEFKRATEVTYLGTVYGTIAALRRMWLRDTGTIVQVGSALSYRGIPLQAPYCGAKHAIRGFTDSLRCELLHDRKNIQVSMVQLPAMNTPQFSWCRTKLPNHPQPVPPIYQPEVAARAIVWVTHHPRRELFVGWPTVTTVWGNKLVPWLGDQYLAHTGYDSQQTDEPVDAHRADNLFETVPGEYSAHGVFDHRATDESWQLELTESRSHITAAAALLMGAAAGLLLTVYRT